jgi:dihydrofolate reductase
MNMRKIIEYTLTSVDGVFGNPAELGFLRFRDEAYLRDGLGVLNTCDAMLMGRNFYAASAKLWQSRPDHPWANRLNEMTKYVFSSTLGEPEWDNSLVLRGDVVTEVANLKATDGGDLVIWGHTRLAETLMRKGLIDILDVSIHPLLVGSGSPLVREGLNVGLRLASTKCFSQIVKLTYEPQYA